MTETNHTHTTSARYPASSVQLPTQPKPSYQAP